MVRRNPTAGSPHIRRARQRPLRDGSVEIGESDRVVAQKPPRPYGMECPFDDRPRFQGRGCSEAVAVVAFAMTDRSAIDVDQQGLVSRVRCPVEHRLEHALVRHRFDVEPATKARGLRADQFHRRRTQVCQTVRDIRCESSTRRTEFALRVKEACSPGGREHQRHGDRLAQETRRQVEVLHRAPAWHEGPVVERATIAADRRFVLAAALDVVEDAQRETGGGQLSYVLDAVASPCKPL